MVMVRVTQTSNWAGSLIQQVLLTLSPMSPLNGKIPMGTALVMSSPASKVTAVAKHPAPVAATDTAARIRMAMDGLTKGIDSHMTPHSGWMQTVMASVTIPMVTKRTNARTH